MSVTDIHSAAGTGGTPAAWPACCPPAGPGTRAEVAWPGRISGNDRRVDDDERAVPSAATGSAALRSGWSHGHRDVSGGWLRPTVFGAVDGLVTNASLIAGLGGGGASAHAVVLTGAAALVAARSPWAPASTSR